MRLLLDTHVVIWAVYDPMNLSVIATISLQAPSNDLVISAATIWEAAIKVGLGKLSLSQPYRNWMSRALGDLGAAILPITVDHADVLVGLPQHHRDPFDRLIIAQSLVEGIAIVSADGQFDAYGVNRAWCSGRLEGPPVCAGDAKRGSPDPDPAFGQVSFQATSRGHETRTSRMRRSGDSKALRWLGFSLITLTTAVAPAREVGEEGQGPGLASALDRLENRRHARSAAALHRRAGVSRSSSSSSRSCWSAAKGTDRLFLGELKGRIYSFPEDPDCKKADLALDLAKAPSRPDGPVRSDLPSASSTRIGIVYVCYVLQERPARRLRRLPVHVSRTDPPVIDPKSEQVHPQF